MEREKKKFLCCKCGEYGYLGRASVSSVYKGTIYGRYYKYYIRHRYSSEKYHKQMERYRNHEIKSRPNGQRRCYLSLLTTQYDSRNGIAWCPYYFPTRTYEGRILEAPKNSMEKIYRPTRPLPPQERPLPLAVRAGALLHDTD